MTTVQTTEITPWWALYTRHQHEKAVADGLSAKGFDVFLPVYESVHLWKDRKKTLTLPLFPCYVFVRGGLNRRLQIVTTPGVHSILSCGGRVATIPDTEIAAIQQSLTGNLQVEPHPYLNCGDRVRVMRGPLEGISGILIRKKNLFRLVFSVEMLARSIAIEVNAADVEPDYSRGSDAVSSQQVGPFAEGLGHGRQVEVHAYMKPPRSTEGEDRTNGILISA